MKDREIIGNAAAAAYAGVSLNAWRPYVARNQAPAPHRREVRGGHALPVWWTSALDEWMRQRPRRGREADTEPATCRRAAD